MTNSQQWTRARADVRKRTTRNKGRTTVRVTGRGELSTLIGAREAHRDAGRVPMAVVDHALESALETAHGTDGDALARLADRWAHAIGADLPELIGTERYAWSQAGTMPTDPGVIASLVTTTVGISGGYAPTLDRVTAHPATVRPPRKPRPYPTRLRIGAYRQRSADPVGTTTVHGRRNIRPDIWRDPVTEKVRPRLRWNVTTLSSLADDDRMFIGHGPMVPRGETVREARKGPTIPVRDSLRSETLGPADMISETIAAAQRSDHAWGRWEWHAADDSRGAVTIAQSGRYGISGSGIRVVGQRSASAAIAAAQRQLAAQ